MVIRSLEELRRHESELLDRINSVHNGGARFLAHPLRMLGDLGIELSPEARLQIIELEPMVSTGSDIAYEALLRAEGEPSVRVRLTEGLFRRAEG